MFRELGVLNSGMHGNEQLSDYFQHVLSNTTVVQQKKKNIDLIYFFQFVMSRMYMYL